MSTRPYPGARRYSYYHRGEKKYIYSRRDPSQAFSPIRLLIGLVYLPFLFAIFTIAQPIFNAQFGKHDTAIVIKDEINVLKSDALDPVLEPFLKKTNVTPAVITVSNETWQRNYSNLEDYAFDRYLAEFNDEMHWLIVYSQPKDAGNNVRETDWYWEGMQGNDTDSVLNEKVTSAFRYTFQQELEQNGDVTKALSKAFTAATEKAKKPNIFENMQFWFIIGMLAFICFHAYFMLGFNDLKYKNAEPAFEDEDNGDNVPMPFTNNTL